MNRLTCGFVGLGLIGGSIAKALRLAIPDAKLIAYDTNTEALLLAKREGTIDEAAGGIGTDFRQCGVVFLCAPVSRNEENLELLARAVSPDCTITDVGSVKTGIHSQIRALGLTGQFIGGHPMTGSERTGYANSKALLLQNAYYILTPCEDVCSARLDSLKELVLAIGAIPLILDSAQHDYVTAAVSHVPHVIASSLVNLVRDSDSEEGIMKMIAAGGFKDITRIASSSPVMWQQICMTNSDNISGLLGSYIKALEDIKSAVEQRDGGKLYSFFETAREYRESFLSASSGPIKRVYEISVDIADETGALASIATILALNRISIKNIGIVHNRETEDGILRIEFYEEASITAASAILVSRGYTIHTKL